MNIYTEIEDDDDDEEDVAKCEFHQTRNHPEMSLHTCLLLR